MKLLIDTHLLIWAAQGSTNLPESARRILANQSNELFFSVASIWEIVIKGSLSRPDFQIDPRALRRGLLNNGYRELTILGEHTLTLESMPAIHKDPFDRLLVAQAMVEGMTLLSQDKVLANYSAPIKLV